MARAELTVPQLLPQLPLPQFPLVCSVVGPVRWPRWVCQVQRQQTEALG